MFRPALRLGFLLALVALPALAGQDRRAAPVANSRPDAAALCRAQCASVANEGLRTRSPAEIAMACNIRCAAGSDFLAQQQRRGTPEATGRGGATAPVYATITTTQRAVAAVTPAAAFSTPAARPAAANFGVVYGARLPAANYSLVVGQPDRLAAHRQAMQQCGTACTPIAEFTEACGAVAQGYKRSQWAMFVTSDPNSFVVTSISAGSGATQAQAEQVAMMECHSRDPRATCRILATSCGRRS